MAESADDRVGLRGHQQHTLPRAGPSHGADSSSGTIDPPIKRRRFQAFDRIVHKIFRRKSKRDDYRGAMSTSDVDVGSSKSTRGKSRSTSELAIVECRSSSSSSTTAAAGSRTSQTLGSGRATTSALSLSHDSVFAPDENDEEYDDADRASSSDRNNPRKLLHFSRRRFSVKGMKEELMNKLRARRDQSVADDEDDDPGLPHSPSSVNTSPTTAEVLGHGLLDERARAKKGSKLRSSDNSLLSMGSSETDNEMEIGGGVGLKLMIFDRRPNADPELDLGPTLLLNHRAAHHRIAIKPRRTHAVPCKHRRLHQVTGGNTSLPMTPEDVEESTALSTGDSPSRSSDDFSTSSDSHHLQSRFQATSIETEIVSEPSASSRATNESAISIGNKSHAAECKLKHEIARYEQRMSESATESMDVDVEVVTTSCFGFGLGRARKTSCSSVATKDAKKPAAMSTSIMKPSIADESKVNLSKVKVFGSRLSGRKKKSDECPATTDPSPSTKTQTSQPQGLASDASRPWSELQSPGRSVDVLQEPGGSKHLRRHSCNVASASDDIDEDVDDDADISGHPSLSSIEGLVPGTSSSSSSSHVWASLEAKRKSVQHQLTKEDIDELESFLPCSRRSLTIASSSSDVRPTRRPLRFSVGSAQEVLPLQLDATAVDEAADASNNNNNESNSFGAKSLRSMDEKTRSSVVRLDIPWIEQGPAKVTAADEDAQQIRASSAVSAEQESAAMSAPLPPAPLRRQKQSKASMGGADAEPELFKVFHRRSLKLKDVDVPVVTQHKKTAAAAAVGVDSPPTCEVEQDEAVNGDVDQNDNNKQQESCKPARAIDASAGEPATAQEVVAADNVRRKASDDPDVEASNEIDPFVSSSPPIIQTNSKSVSTRSSKVLDLVRNFQKLQAT